MNPIKAIATVAVLGAVAVGVAAEPAAAGSTQRYASKHAQFQRDPSYRAAMAAFQKVAGRNILTDGTFEVWSAAPGEIADSVCEADVGHRSWGKERIDVTNAVCDSVGGGALGYSVLLSRDKKYLGLVIQWGAGSSGAISYQLITYRRTHTPIEGGKDDYFGQIKSQWL